MAGTNSNATMGLSVGKIIIAIVLAIAIWFVYQCYSGVNRYWGTYVAQQTEDLGLTTSTVVLQLNKDGSWSLKGDNKGNIFGATYGWGAKSGPAWRAGTNSASNVTYITIYDQEDGEDVVRDYFYPSDDGSVMYYYYDQNESPIAFYKQ